MYNFEVSNTLPNAPNKDAVDDQKNIINELVQHYDDEIARQRKNAKLAFAGMMASLVICVFVFLAPNFAANSYQQDRISTYPVQDSIRTVLDTQNYYRVLLDNTAKRFNDIRILQNKYNVAGLDTLYFQVYEDDATGLNSMFSHSAGSKDSTTASSPRKALVFGGELPMTSYHNPLSNTFMYVKLFPSDTMQDRNITRFKNGILAKQKDIIDLLSSLRNRIESNIVENKRSFEFMDALSVRIGAFLILVFMIHVLVHMQRYYNKLAQYYLSRRNALKLQLTNNKNLGFENIVNLLSPDEIELKLPQYINNKTGFF